MACSDTLTTTNTALVHKHLESACSSVNTESYTYIFVLISHNWRAKRACLNAGAHTVTWQ